MDHVEYIYNMYLLILSLTSVCLVKVPHTTDSVGPPLGT